MKIISLVYKIIKYKLTAYINTLKLKLNNTLINVIRSRPIYVPYKPLSGSWSYRQDYATRPRLPNVD